MVKRGVCNPSLSLHPNQKKKLGEHLHKTVFKLEPIASSLTKLFLIYFRNEIKLFATHTPEHFKFHSAVLVAIRTFFPRSCSQAGAISRISRIPLSLLRAQVRSNRICKGDARNARNVPNVTVIPWISRVQLRKEELRGINATRFRYIYWIKFSKHFTALER